MAKANAVNKEMPAGAVVGTTDTQTLSAKTLTSPIINTSISGTAFLDEDNMASDSATKVASQQSIKAYVDAQVAGVDTFLELTDTPATYTTDGALYVADNTNGQLDESTVILTEGVNTFALAKGTASLDVAAGSVLNVDANLTVESASFINQDLTSDATGVAFGSMQLGGAGATPTEFSTDGTLAGDSDLAIPTEKAVKLYVDTNLNGLKWKESVTVASAGNLTLSGEQTIDGVLTSADRILVKDQSTASENGIYVTASGAWARAADYATGDTVASTAVFVEQGTTQADTGWVCTSDSGSDVVGTNNLAYAQFDGGSITAGNGLTRTGNSIFIDTTITADLSTSQTFTNKILTTPTIGDFTNATHDHADAAGGGQLSLTTAVTGVLDETNGGTGQSTLTTGDILYASASNTLSKLAVGSDGQVLKLASGIPSWASDVGGAVTEITADTAAAVNNAYIANKAATRCVLTLPAVAAVGEYVEIIGKGATGWEIAQGAGQQIHFGVVDTTSGATGKVQSSDTNDVTKVMCVTANDEWVVTYSIGNPDVL